MTDIERQILGNQFDIMAVMASLIIKYLPRDCTEVKGGEDTMDNLIKAIHDTGDLLAAVDAKQRDATILERMKTKG